MMTATDRASEHVEKYTGRGRFRARTIVAVILIGVSVLSVGLVALVNYFSAENLLNDTAEAQLMDIGGARARRIERGVDTLADAAVTFAEDDGVIAALDDLTDGYRALDERLSAAEEDELAEWYQVAISQVTPPGFPVPSVESLLPGSELARYLQYHYLVQNPLPADKLAALDDAGDGSEYSAAHGRHHPTLREMRDATGLGDLLLIDAGSDTVVYSVDKNVDFGTDLRIGPHRRSRLATRVLREVEELPPGEAAVIDFDAYAPAGGAPTAFVAAPIRDDGTLVGAVALAFPATVLTAITTSLGQWEQVGLGETGEVYIVGADQLMRSDSRLAIEDLEDYQAELADAGYDAELGEAVEALGTTVLVQPVETDAVAAGADGGTFQGVSRGYLGQETVTVAGPLVIPGVNWIAVAEVATAEAHKPLGDYLRRVLITALILMPIVALLGVWIARRLIKPVSAVVAATRTVSGGDLDVTLPDTSRDEFGELGRRFNDMVAVLRTQRTKIARSDAEITELLGAALPRRLVEEFKEGHQEVAESVRNGTIIAIALDGLVDEQATDQEALRDAGVELFGTLAHLAEDNGIEPIHSSSSQLLFAAGLESGELESLQAARFTMRARNTVESFARSQGLHVEFRAGLSAGELVAGLVGSDRLAYDAWGDPPRLAIALAAVAETDEVLGGTTVVEALGRNWPTRRATDLVDLAGRALDGWSLGDDPEGEAAMATETTETPPSATGDPA